MNTNELVLQHIARRGKDSSSLLILLHGYGSNEQDMFGFAPVFDERFTIISVRAPRAIPDNDYAWFDLAFTANGDLTYESAQIIEAQQKLTQFIGEAAIAYSIEPKQIFLLGFSQGGMMSALMALSKPELIRGAIVLSGWVPLEAHTMLAPPDLRSAINVFIGHGIFDDVVPVKQGRAARDTFAAFGVPHVYHEYATAHHINEQGLDDVATWLDPLI